MLLWEQCNSTPAVVAILILPQSYVLIDFLDPVSLNPTRDRFQYIFMLHYYYTSVGHFALAASGINGFCSQLIVVYPR